MLDVIEQHRDDLAAMCRRYGVRQLELFGSATGSSFDRRNSDLDFLVIFSQIPTATIDEQYFGLLGGLETLFGRKVDLVDIRAARNPYFIAEALKQRVVLYAA